MTRKDKDRKDTVQLWETCALQELVKMMSRRINTLRELMDECEVDH